LWQIILEVGSDKSGSGDVRVIVAEEREGRKWGVVFVPLEKGAGWF